MSKNFSKRRLVCCRCQNAQPALKRSKTGEPICKPCFFEVFELEVHETITKYGLFNRGEKVAIAASGGKDSTVLAHVLQVLNERFDYGVQLCLLAVDEGISGYRDDSLDSLRKYQERSGLPLNIVSYGELYGGWTMDRVVRAVGRSNNCTFCGVFRRQALDRGAALIGANKLVTGHNADDLAETVVMNILRGDLARLARCTDVVTWTDGMIPRCKPLKYAFQKEIVHYAYLQRLEYFATECSYAPMAYRLNVRNYVKSLERCAPLSILDILDAAEKMRVREGVRMPRLTRCERCTYVSSQSICKACVLLDGLNAGLPQFGIGRAPKMRRMLRERQQAAEADGQQSQSACKGTCACRAKCSPSATQCTSDNASSTVCACQSAKCKSKCNRKAASQSYANETNVKDRPEQHDDDADIEADSSCGGSFSRLLDGRATQEQHTSSAASEELSDFLSAIDL